ncbi:MAG: matrixin family metalloprotease [bacterium]|nr:matrixin family metalloprotease [bacterium]
MTGITELSGTISASTTWTRANNVYVVTSTVTIATHELGHALGLEHSYWGNIMYYNPTYSTNLGDQDKNDYNFLWQQ